MERYLHAEERKQLTEIADQWRRTEDETNQNRVLQSLNNYAKLFLSRLEKSQYVSIQDGNGAPFISENSGEVKTGNGTESSTTDTTCEANSIPETQASTTRPNKGKISEDKRSRPHTQKEDIALSGDRKKKLQKILQIGHDRVELEELIKVFDRDMCSGMDWSHPTFFGFVPGCGHLLYSASEFLTSIAHVSAVARFENAVLCDVEESVLRWVIDIIGYPQHSKGVTTSGTSMSDVLAFSTARYIKLAHSSEFSRTDFAHPCQTRALRLIGLTDVVLRRVPTLEYRMDVGKLEEMITEDRVAGLCPFMVVGTAGTTSLGAVDPLAEISEVAEKHGLWFHVDAAIGGILMLDDSVKKRCKGINMADSVSMDFHKALSSPLGTAAVLVRDGSHLKSTMARDSAPYYSDTSQEEDYSPVDFTFEFTRPFRAFPVWFILKILGIDMIKTVITEKMRLTKYAYKAINDMTNVVTCMEPDLTVIAFRYVPADDKDGNDVTRKWHELISEEGQVFLTPTTVDGMFYVRLCILSFRSHIEDVDTALTSIKRNLDVIRTGKDLLDLKVDLKES